MSLAKDLDIYKAADALLILALQVQAQVPRAYRVAVGQVIKPWRRVTRKRTVGSALQRLASMPAADTFTAGNSYLGLVRQATHSHQHQAAIANVLRKRGHAVAGDLSKVFRRAN